MRHFYIPDDPETGDHVITAYGCGHPMYDFCTLYLNGEKGLAVVRQYFNPKMKHIWWDNLDRQLAIDIYKQDDFWEYFNEHADEPDENGLYPTVPIRKIMWALRMKPLRKEYWEDDTLHREKFCSYNR